MNKLILSLIFCIALVFSSCEVENDPVPICSQTVTSWVLEGYYDNVYWGYGQYTVYTVDSYGNTYFYTDATRVPSVGMCWVY